jgi:hypothetical protein
LIIYWRPDMLTFAKVRLPLMAISTALVMTSIYLALI